ncbi:c-type cytochrome [Akkermansiaceae bacterium]|nr:c-type cytochrome [Akkermansiaceae bacterium]MDB4544758.1 c-type cytochrome [Akkermansiaceae bacterium]
MALGLYLHHTSQILPSKRIRPASASTFQQTCATCHGTQGEGNHSLMAPPIANLTEWYAREQVTKFRSGLRGNDPRDQHGQLMREAVSTLSDEEIEDALTELSTLPFVPPKPSTQGDPNAGEAPFREFCMECHRYNGHGELAFKSAPIAALPDWYITAQISKFLDGRRGYHPDDEAGHKMQKMALRPESKEQLANIIAYITTLAKEHPIEKDTK